MNEFFWNGVFAVITGVVLGLYTPSITEEKYRSDDSDAWNNIAIDKIERYSGGNRWLAGAGKAAAGVFLPGLYLKYMRRVTH